MPTLDRAAAWTLLCEYTKTQPLRRHALAVEASMRALARRSGGSAPAELEAWGLVGLLHDFDHERWPTIEEHPARGAELLRAGGWPEPLVDAIVSHALPAATPRQVGIGGGAAPDLVDGEVPPPPPPPEAA